LAFIIRTYRDARSTGCQIRIEDSSKRMGIIAVSNSECIPLMWMWQDSIYYSHCTGV